MPESGMKTDTVGIFTYKTYAFKVDIILFMYLKHLCLLLTLLVTGF